VTPQRNARTLSLPTLSVFRGVNGITMKRQDPQEYGLIWRPQRWRGWPAGARLCVPLARFTLKPAGLNRRDLIVRGREAACPATRENGSSSLPFFLGWPGPRLAASPSRATRLAPSMSPPIQHPAASCSFLSFWRAVTRSLSCWRKGGSNGRARLIE
jgi:hypothetical protein